MEKKRPSLRDIARELNISPSTVSLALRNNPRITEQRREQVRKKADELGYVPDPVLSSLIAYRNGKRENPVVSTIAWINRWPKADDLRARKEFDDYWRGAERTATQLGYRLESFVVDAELKGARLNEILLSRGVKGILLPPHPEGVLWCDFGIEWERFSVVRFGYSIRDLKVHMVGSDQMGGAEMVVNRMAQAGKRRLGFVSQESFDLRTRGNFRLGYTFGVDMNPEMARIDPFVLTQRIRENGELDSVNEAALDLWLKRGQVDSILTTEPELAQWLKRRGVRVPEDIALVATSAYESPDINTGLDQNGMEIGKVAVQVLVGCINRNEIGLPANCRRVSVIGDWVEGDTFPAGDVLGNCE